MKGTLGLVLLTLGIIISASFGARNGARHVEYRQASALYEAADDANRPALKATRDAIGLPPPRQRLQEWFVVGGLGWLGGLSLIVVGAVLSRMQVAEDNAGTGTTQQGRVDFVQTLKAVRAQIEVVSNQIAELPMDADSEAPRALLDAIQSEHLQPLVEGRGQLIAKHGLGGFAGYFGTFSAAERNLNRCWSALTDGHSVVAREALVISDQAFVDAIRQYEEVDARG